MNVYSKLKSEELRTEAVIWMVIGPIMLLFLLFFGIGILLVIPICIVYGLVSFLLFLRTLNTGYMIKTMMFLFLMVSVISLFLTGTAIFTLFAWIITLLSLIWLIFMISNRDYKWRTRELLELAAMPVEEVKNGYTDRPMPTGKLDYKWEELIRFSNFIRRNLISVVYYENEKVVFGLNHSKFKLITFSGDYSQDSWVAFDKQGNISVHISAENYRLFKDAYAFDQLCDTLGNVYADFFRLFQQGKESEILKRLDFIRI